MAHLNGRRSVALLGDTLLTRQLSVFREAGFLKIKKILNDADAVFTNFDSNVHNYLDDPYVQRPSAGSYMTTEPALLEDLKWIGINMVACGSTHADDYGPKGFLDTIRYLDAAGITHAGSGRHLAEARSPGYRDTANGRFALLAASASFHHGSRAGEQRPDTLGWPGVNGLRNRKIHYLAGAQLDQLRSIGDAIGWKMARIRDAFQVIRAAADDDETYNFLGHTFKLGQEPGKTSVANQEDVDGNLRYLRNTRAFADCVIASLHCHDQGGPSLKTADRRSKVEDTADFVVDYGRQCIDAGADIFVAHGPQVPLGIEIYNGKPLFHGLGTFIFQLETVKYLPSECYERYGLDHHALPADFLDKRYKSGTRGHAAEPAQWEQVFAVVDFEGDALREIRLFPISLGFEYGPSQRGRPILAEGSQANRILERVQRLSKRFGTEIEIIDEIGYIRLT